MIRNIKVVFIDGSSKIFEGVESVNLCDSDTLRLNIPDNLFATQINIRAIKYLEEV